MQRGQLAELPEGYQVMQGCQRCKCKPNRRSDRGDGWETNHGPSEIVLRDFGDEQFAAIVTDPPYCAGANGLMGRQASTNTKYRTTGAKRLPEIERDAMLPEAWDAMMRGVWAECYRVAAGGTDVLAFCDWRSYNAMLLQIGAAGFNPRGVLLWNKGRGTRPQKNGFRSQTEWLIWARKGKATPRANDVYLDGVFHHPTRIVNKRHLTEKPVPLMRELLGIVAPGSVVLDPFMGSATTGVAAAELGHRFVGIEASAEIYADAVERLRGN